MNPQEIAEIEKYIAGRLSFIEKVNAVQENERLIQKALRNGKKFIEVNRHVLKAEKPPK